jgi:Ca2+/H+ antiporter, TMEM165/GDT1 family
LLAATVALTGGALVRVPLNDLHLLVGVVLLAFGFSWLRKAVLRTAGMKAPRDEAAIFTQRIDQMRSKVHPGLGNGLDLVAMTAAFKAVVIEGIEVVFIVVAVGHLAGALVPAALGAATARFRSGLTGDLYSSSTDPSAGKCAHIRCGFVMVSFGIFWLGEGLGLAWPGADLAMVAIIAGVFALAHFVRGRLPFREQAQWTRQAFYNWCRCRWVVREISVLTLVILAA